MTTFRVHMADGRKVDVDAETPADAAKAVVGRVVKIKRVRTA